MLAFPAAICAKLAVCFVATAFRLQLVARCCWSDLPFYGGAGTATN